MCGYGGIGRHAGFRFQWATVQVQVLLPAPKRRESERDSLLFGGPPPAGNDPLRSNSWEGIPNPHPSPPHAKLISGSDLDCPGAPRRSSPRTAQKMAIANAVAIFHLFPRGSSFPTEKAARSCGGANAPTSTRGHIFRLWTILLFTGYPAAGIVSVTASRQPRWTTDRTAVRQRRTTALRLS